MVLPRRKKSNDTETIRRVVKLKMVGNRARGRPKLKWTDTVWRDLKAWKNGPLTGNDGNVYVRHT